MAKATQSIDDLLELLGVGFGVGFVELISKLILLLF